MFDDIDESELDWNERLCLAWCRLNCGRWDEEVLGEKPDDDEANIHAMDAIESIVGKAYISRCWDVFSGRKTDAEWFRWYTVDRYVLRKQLFDDAPDRFGQKGASKCRNNSKRKLKYSLVSLFRPFLR